LKGEQEDTQRSERSGRAVVSVEIVVSVGTVVCSEAPAARAPDGVGQARCLALVRRLEVPEVLLRLGALGALAPARHNGYVVYDGCEVNDAFRRRWSKVRSITF